MTPREEGYLAAQRGIAKSKNPYRGRVDQENASKWYEWDAGWRSFYIDNRITPNYNGHPMNDD